MNILFAVGKLTGGGAERVCVSVANGLARFGHSVYILTNSVSEKDYFLDPRIKIFIWGEPVDWNISLIRRVVKRIHIPFVYTRALQGAIKISHADVLINILGLFMLESIIVCKMKGIKHIFSDHNSYERPPEAPMSKIQHFEKFYLSRFCDLTTVLTNRDKEVLKGRRDVKVSPNPLFLPILKDMPSKQQIILAVGRLDAWYVKGFDILIKSWGKICKEFPEWKLRIVGSGSNDGLNRLKGFVADNDAERVEFQDFRGDIEEEYKAASVFVLSSRYEGFGLVLTEAMSQRCACIACNYLTRQSDIVTDGFDGLLCNVDDAEDLACKLKLLLKNDALRKNIQAHSADKLQRFIEPHIAKMWELDIQQLIQNGDEKNRKVYK